MRATLTTLLQGSAFNTATATSSAFQSSTKPRTKIRCQWPQVQQSVEKRKRCLRCNTYYLDKENGPDACSFHGHINGDRGLYSLAPPHQGIDGEWSDASGVIVYKWNDTHNRPNTGRPNWKKRWSCCGEYDDMAPPCRRGWHLSYDDGATLF